MNLDTDDKEWIKMTARELTFQVTKEVLEEHIKTCPFGKRQINYKHLILGVLIGAGLLGGGGGLTMLFKTILGL